MRLDFSESKDDTEASFDFEDHNTEDIHTIIGYKWIDVELSEIPTNVKSVEINAKMSVNNGRIGIFVPSSDFVSYGNTMNPSFDYLYQGADKQLFIDSDRWKFGSEASITVESPKGKFSDSIISFSILTRPIMTDTSSFNLELRVIPSEGKSITKKLEVSPGRKLEKDDKLRNMIAEFNKFEKYDVTKLSGLGNIIHPKQYLTLRGLKMIMEDDFFRQPRESYKIGYIGTDTTENIRSIIRWLSEQELIEKVSQFIVFYTTDWDYKLLQHVGFREKLKEQYPNFNCKFVELSEQTVEYQKNQPNCDIMISTYVAPWVTEETEPQFKNLLSNCLGDDCYLLSVDPKTGPDSVRSALKKQRINNDTLYENKLNLSVAKRPVHNENQSVEYSIWKPSSGAVQ